MKVLIALDDSPASLRAARTAARLFGPAGSEFLVINVAAVPVPWIDSGFGFGVVAPMAFDPKWFAHDVARSEDEEAALLRRAQSAGVPHPEPLVAAGDAATQINRAAEEHDVDAIVVGSHGKSALRQLFDPSVSTGVLRHTTRPVLVVAESPDEGTDGAP